MPTRRGRSPQERQTPSSLFNKKFQKRKSVRIKKIPEKFYSTHTLQSCFPHGILSIFHFSAHILMPRMISTSSSPLFVRVYSLFTGNVVASTFLVIDAFLFQFLQPLREDLLGDIPKRVHELREAARVLLSLVEFEDDQERPFFCKIFHREVDRAGFIHGIFSETLSYLTIVYKRNLVVKPYKGV